MTNGICDDCFREIQIGEWPYDCAGKGHILYIRLAFQPQGRTVDYAPPMPINPVKEPKVDRQWMNPDGTTRPMKQDEWMRKDSIPGLQ